LGGVHGHRGEDAHAGGDEVDGRAVVGEVGQGVVLLRAARRRRALAAGLPVGIGQGGDGDHLVIGGGNQVRRVLVVVAGGHDVGHASGHRGADRLVEDVVVGLAAVAVVGPGTPEAQVGDVDVVLRIAVGPGARDPVDPAQQLPGGAVALVVEDLHAVHVRPRRHADDPDVVVEGADRARGVRTVPVVVVVAAGLDAGGPAGHVQVGVPGVDAGVEHRHVDVDAGLLDAVDGGRLAHVGPHPLDAGRDDLPEGRDLLVGLHRLHQRIGPQGGGRRRAH